MAAAAAGGGIASHFMKTLGDSDAILSASVVLRQSEAGGSPTPGHSFFLIKRGGEGAVILVDGRR